MPYKRLLILGGISGIISTVSYAAAVTLPVNDLRIGLVLGMIWAILGIGYAYALYTLVGNERPGVANRFAFLLAVIGFSIVASMISVQLAVRTGIAGYTSEGGMQNGEMWIQLRRMIRLVDMGLDVAWDMFIGSSLAVIAFPMLKHSRLGWRWAFPSAILGSLLVIINIMTFPFPPVDRGFVDVGPVIGVFVVALSIHMIRIGRRNLFA